MILICFNFIKKREYMAFLLQNNNCITFPYLCKLTELLDKLSNSTQTPPCFIQLPGQNQIQWNPDIIEGVLTIKQRHVKKNIMPLIIIVSVMGHASIILIINKQTYTFGLDVDDISYIDDDVIYPDVTDSESYGLIQPKQSTSKFRRNIIIQSPDFMPYNTSYKTNKRYSDNAIIRTIFPFKPMYLQSIIKYINNNIVNTHFSLSKFMITLNQPYNKYCIDGTNCGTFIENMFPDELNQSYVSLPNYIYSVKRSYEDTNNFIKYILEQHGRSRSRSRSRSRPKKNKISGGKKTKSKY